MARSRPSAPSICVLTVSPQLTVTIEPPAQAPTEAHAPGEDTDDARGEDGAEGLSDEIHVHVGGQGLWVGRMAESLGAEVVVCGPFGGESGEVVAHLADREGFELRVTPVVGSSGAYVHDRRGGERTEIARMSPPPLGRHELDDLYGSVLVAALDADVTVLTGPEPPSVAPADFVGRLAADLRAQGRTVVADASGDVALAVLEAGLTVLKMSHTEVVEAGLASGDGLAQLREGARALLDRAGAVVVSRAAEPTLVVTPEREALVRAPGVTTVDHRGAGDSMTAGVAVGIARGLEVVEAARLGTAAGALNVTRRGLGSGRPEQIERFAQEVHVEDLD